MNFFSGLFASIFGRKKPEPVQKLYVQQFGRGDRSNSMRVGKSQGSPSQRQAEATRQQDDIMSNPLHPLNPLSPISIYNDYTPSEPSRNDCSDYSGSSSGSYDSGSSSCDSGSSSSSSD